MINAGYHTWTNNYNRKVTPEVVNKHLTHSLREHICVRPSKMPSSSQKNKFHALALSINCIVIRTYIFYIYLYIFYNLNVI
jgi:hypothetical protein